MIFHNELPTDINYMFHHFREEQQKYEDKQPRGLKVSMYLSETNTIYIGIRNSPRYTRICSNESKIYLELELKSQAITPFRELFQKKNIQKFYFHALDEFVKKINKLCNSQLTNKFMGLVWDVEDKLQEYQKFYIINSPTFKQKQIDKALNLYSPKMMKLAHEHKIIHVTRLLHKFAEKYSDPTSLKLLWTIYQIIVNTYMTKLDFPTFKRMTEIISNKKQLQKEFPNENIANRQFVHVNLLLKLYVFLKSESSFSATCVSIVKRVSSSKLVMISRIKFL